MRRQTELCGTSSFCRMMRSERVAMYSNISPQLREEYCALGESTLEQPRNTTFNRQGETTTPVEKRTAHSRQPTGCQNMLPRLRRCAYQRKQSAAPAPAEGGMLGLLANFHKIRYELRTDCCPFPSQADKRWSAGRANGTLQTTISSRQSCRPFQLLKLGHVHPSALRGVRDTCSMLALCTCLP